MNQRSSLTLSKFILKYPFTHIPKPISSFSPKLFTTKSYLPPKPTSNSPSFNPTPLRRCYSTGFDKNKVVDEINSKFAEAREEIEAAMDSKETVYFNEEAECARTAVNEVLEMFDGLLAKLDPQDRDALLRSMGLKIEQLKAELQQLND